MEPVLEGGAEETPSSAPAPSTDNPSTSKGDEPANPAPDPSAPGGEPQEVLYELPDGRKVDAQALQKEWKENFLPDYTRKSQELADAKKILAPEQVKPAQQPWEDPNWEPKSWGEVINTAKARIEAEAETKAEAERQKQEHIKSVTDQMETEVKKLDPQADMNAVYAHANKFKIPDLVSAYNNLQEMKNLEKNVEQRVLKNLKGREADPVSTGNGEPSDGGVSYNQVSGTDMMTAAQEALRRAKGN